MPTIGGEPAARLSAQAPPLNMTVLIDVSFTMHPRLPERSTDKFVNGLSAENIGRGLARLFDLLAPVDRIRLAIFSGPPVFLTPFTSERSTLDGALRQFEALTFDDRFGPSPIWDALVAAAEAPPTGPDGRLQPHSILLISDGRATANRIRLNTAIERLLALRTTVCAIGIPVKADFSDGQRTYVIDGADYLKRIAGATGGLHLQYNPPDEHAFPLFERVLRYLRSERVGAGADLGAFRAR
jgi:hypothetical protein